MQERNRQGDWVRCPNCRHKLFMMLSQKPLALQITLSNMDEGVPKVDGDIIQAKCHSCKEIVDIRL